jgi:predicted membrane-bound spermidine synthase
VRDDGRRRLRADGRRYDIVVADAIDLDNSLITHLYSAEYYRLVRASLKPGGLVCVLARTPRIRAAVQRSLPYTVNFRADLMLASPEPISIDLETWRARLHSDRSVDYLGRTRIREIAAFLERASYGFALPPTADMNRDLEPKDEFFRPPVVIYPLSGAPAAKPAP